MINKLYYNDSPEYCHPFFNLLATDDLLSELKQSKEFTLELIHSITKDKENYRYAPNKWTTKEVLRHVIDCERIYTYRALRFSRHDNTELAGFDENLYIANTNYIEHSLLDLNNEFEAVRNSTIALYKPMTSAMLDFKGKANNVGFTARTLGFMTVGHNIHHCNIIKEKYLGI